MYAGVGKSDWEINLGLDSNILCFNVESVAELEVINELAEAKGKTASVAFRVNPNVGAHTHANITTGLAENKFGIALEDLLPTIEKASAMKNVSFIGLHFHIGSQILDMGDFEALCAKINEIQDSLDAKGIVVENINVGGGLGISYDDPNGEPIPNFKAYFSQCLWRTHRSTRRWVPPRRKFRRVRYCSGSLSCDKPDRGQGV